MSELDRAIRAYTARGWYIVSQTPTAAQLRKPRQWNVGCLITCAVCVVAGVFASVLWYLVPIGLVIAVLDYLLKKEQTIYLTEEELRVKQPQ